MKNLDEVLGYSTAYIRSLLDEQATKKDKMSWLFAPWDSLKGRVVLVAHIDTVHDKTITKGTSRGFPTATEPPEYLRTIGGKVYECIKDGKWGEYRREKGDKTYKSVRTVDIDKDPGQVQPIETDDGEGLVKFRDFDLFYDSKRKVYWSPDGLGADDRAGVWGVMRLFNRMPKTLQPALLLTDGEESGCIGAREAVTSFGDMLKECIGFIELDRKGHKDAVYYNTEPDDWRKLFTRHGFVSAGGTTSDVSVLGRELELCTVNLSIGYEDQHRQTEHLYETVCRTNVDKVERIVRELTALGQQWRNKKKPVTSIGYTRPWDDYDGYDEYEYGWYSRYNSHYPRQQSFPVAGHIPDHQRRPGEMRHRKWCTETRDWVDVHPPERWNATERLWEDVECRIINCQRCAREEELREEHRTLAGRMRCKRFPCKFCDEYEDDYSDYPATLEQIVYEQLGSYGTVDPEEIIYLSHIPKKELKAGIMDKLPWYCTVCNLLYGEEYYKIETNGWCPLCGEAGDESEMVLDTIPELEEEEEAHGNH